MRLYPWTGCRTDAWCPDCQQVIRDWTCNCAGVCDIHDKTKPGRAPKAVVPVRRPGEKEPYTTVDYTNVEDEPMWIPEAWGQLADGYAGFELDATGKIVARPMEDLTTGAGI